MPHRLRALAFAAKAVAQAVLLAAPTGFRWTTAPIAIQRQPSGALTTTFDPTAHIPAVTNTWYVDPVNGSDSTAVVNDRTKPLLNLSTAVAKTDVDQIRIINLTGDFLARGARGWNNALCTRSISVIVEGPYRFISAQVTNITPPTWTVNATYSNVYQSAFTATNSQHVTDTSIKTTPTYTDGTVKSVSQVPQMFAHYRKVASVAAVAAEAGSWYNDGTNTYVRAINDRSLVGDTALAVTNGSNNGRFPVLSNITIYVQGIDFIGGRPFQASATEAQAVSNNKLVLNHCSLQGSGSFNGLNVSANMTVISYRCGAYFNSSDGFNYACPTSPTAAGLGISPTAIEIECCTKGNGSIAAGGPVIDNSSSAVNYSAVIRLNCVAVDANDRVISDQDNAHSWNLGCVVGQATTVAAARESIAALNSAQVWLDSVNALAGSNPRWIAAGTAVLRHYNSGAVANAGTAEATGTVTTYTP